MTQPKLISVLTSSTVPGRDQGAVPAQILDSGSQGSRSSHSSSSRSSSGLATLIAGAATNAVVTVVIGVHFGDLIKTGDWRIILGTLVTLALVGAPTSTVPLVREFAGRFLPGGR